LAGLVSKISAAHPQHLRILPGHFHSSGLQIGLATVLVYFSARWWIQVYGGAEPGGGTYVAQRMLSAKSEKHALYATLWFNIAHYAVRPWPWILTGLACILIFPHARNGDIAYIQCINLIPSGLKGLVLAAFFAALMAIDTRLNLGAAYLVNDFYRPFLVPGKSERHYVTASRIATCAQVGLGLIYALLVTRVKTAFFLTTAIGSGAGLVYALRWYWWRVNAWSEITGLAAGLCNVLLFRFVIFPSEQSFNDHGLQVLLWSGLVVTTLWIAVTFLTPPSDREQLKRFYAKVRPAGPFWKPIAREVERVTGPIEPGYSVPRALVSWISGTAMVLCILFGTGKLLLEEPRMGAMLIGAGILSLIVLRRSMQMQNEAPVVSEEPIAAAGVDSTSNDPSLDNA